MSDREIATALRLLNRWRAFVAAGDPTAPAFAATYQALCAETDDFLGTDNDPPRDARTCGHCGRVHDGKGQRCHRCGHLLPTVGNVSASKSAPT